MYSSSIPVGSVILVEPPYASIAKDGDGGCERCDNCLQSVNLTPVPCRQCANVVFCSTYCRDEASGYSTYHIYFLLLDQIEIHRGSSTETILYIHFIELF